MLTTSLALAREAGVKDAAAKEPEAVNRLKEPIAKWNATLPKEYRETNDKD